MITNICAGDWLQFQQIERGELITVQGCVTVDPHFPDCLWVGDRIVADHDDEPVGDIIVLAHMSGDATDRIARAIAEADDNSRPGCVVRQAGRGCNGRGRCEMSATAHDMSQHWRLISAEAANDTHRVYGTWWAAREYIKAVDVTIWSREMRCGWVFYSSSLTAFIETDGSVRIPKHMVRGSDAHQFAAEEAWELLLSVVQAVADTAWIGAEA